MYFVVTWKKLAIGDINGKWYLTAIPTNKQMKLSSLKNKTQFSLSIC